MAVTHDLRRNNFVFGVFLGVHQKDFVCTPDYSLLIIILVSVIYILFKSSQYYLCTPAREPGGSPIHGPCRTFRALRSPRRCRLHYGGPGTLLTASLPALHCGLALPGKVHIPARAPFHLGAHPGVAFLLRLVGSPAARLLGAQDLSSTLSPHFMEEGSCTGTGALSGQGYICGGHY